MWLQFYVRGEFLKYVEDFKIINDLIHFEIKG
jgi:hypothetical protein